MAASLDPDEVLRSTRGKGNFQRLARLLISGGTTLLRETVDLICPPRSLPTKLRNPTTEKQLKAAKLTKPQWDCLYPSPGVYGKSEDCDVTLLFKLLRTICNFTPPATGWDALPTTTDHSLAADLARIKYYRNSVYAHVNQNMEVTDSEFLSLSRNITEALVRIAGHISPAKKHEWQKAIGNFLKDPLTAEDERNVQELLKWYEKDTDVKQSLEKFKTSTQEGLERLETSLKGVQSEQKEIKDVMVERVQFLETAVREATQDTKDQLKGELKSTTQKVQGLENAVREEAQDIKDQLTGELKTTAQNVQGLVRDQAQDIKDHLGGELKTTAQNVQGLVRDQAQDIKDQLGGELKTTAQNGQGLVRDQAQDIKDKLDEVQQSIDGFRSTAGSSQAFGVQIRVRLDCEAISGTGARGGAAEIVTTSQKQQPSVQSASVNPVAPYQQQASPTASCAGTGAYADLPPTQGVLNFIALNSFKAIDPSNPEELNGYVQYLRDVRNVLFVDAQQGSLIITLDCRSLEILEGLWEDYCSGLLNEMAQTFLVTEEVLKEFGLIAVKLTTTILVEEYIACRQHFFQSEVHPPRYNTRKRATGFGPQVKTSESGLTMSKSTKKRPSKEFIIPGKPHKQIKSSNDQEQIDTPHDHDHDNQAAWFPNSIDSRDSQTENTLKKVLPMDMDVLDEDSSEMDVDENNPDPSCRFAEHCLHLKIKVGKEKSSLDSVLQPTCALLNSGGGLLLIKIDNYAELKSHGKSPLQELDKFWQGFEEKLKALVKPLSYNEVFDRKIEQDEVFLFVKASDHWCTLDYNLFSSGDSQVSDPSFSEIVQLLTDKPLEEKENFSYCKVRLYQLPSLPEKFKYKEELGFHESKTMQFKNYTSKNPILHNNSHKERDKFARQISAFANGSGGIILLGVEDDCTVFGQDMDSEGNSQEELQQRLNSIVNAMKWSCTPEKRLHWDVKFFPVQGRECYFVIAIYVAGVRGGVFTKTPKSYELRRGDDGKEAIYSVEFREWKEQMLRGRSILQNGRRAMKHLTEKFTRLAISSGVLLTVQDSVGRIRDSFFTVKDDWPLSPKGAVSNLPKAAQDVITQIQDMLAQGRTHGVILVSRSWLRNVDPQAARPDGLTCDLLLVSQDFGGLHLFTLCEPGSEKKVAQYSGTAARNLKKSLVLEGGCQEKFYISNRVVPCSATPKIDSPCANKQYPEMYDMAMPCRIFPEKLHKILEALAIVLAKVPSMLSNSLGVSFLNLLTEKQYQLVHEEIEYDRELWIKGPAGSGKTLVAVEFMRQLRRRDEHLEKNEILYVCENKGLREQVWRADVCECVCRKSFMTYDYSEVKHVVMDEVQSFRAEDGDWLEKARRLVCAPSDDPEKAPGFLWLFIDNSQVYHSYATGIPAEKEQTPHFRLKKVIRNSKIIFELSKNFIHKDAASKIELGHDFLGEKVMRVNWDLKEVLKYLFSEGYSEAEIAVLYGKGDCIPDGLRSELNLSRIDDAERNNSDYLVVSTLRMYSGLERPVVVLVNLVETLPYGSPPESSIYCAVTRAMVKLVLIEQER